MEKYAKHWIRLDVPTLEQQLEEEHETLIYLQEHSDEGRDTHHGYIIETTADEEHKEIHVIAKEMKARETQARMYKHIGAALNTRHYSSVNKIGIPRDMQNDSTASIWDRFQQMTQDEIDKLEWVSIEDPQVIETRLLEWNVLHFNQASSTQLANETWEAKLNPCGKTDAELDQIGR